MIPSIKVKSKEDLSYKTIHSPYFFYYELEIILHSYVSKFLPNFYTLQLLLSHPSHPLIQHIINKMPSKCQPVLGFEYTKINKTNFHPPRN